MSEPWTRKLMSIHNTIIFMGTFQHPLDPDLTNLTYGEWQMERARRILATVEEEQRKEEEERRTGEKRAVKPGWDWIFGSLRWHYFMEDGKSLCGAWRTLEDSPHASESYDDDNPQNCFFCARRLKSKMEMEKEERG